MTATGSGADPEDGRRPPSALSCTVLLYHVDQQNPGNIHRPTFTMPEPEDIYAGPSYLELRLTVTDSDGLTGEAVRTANPKRVQLPFSANQPGLRVLVRGVAFTTPYPATAWPDWRVASAAPPTHFKGLGTQWNFQSWSDGGAATHNLTTPINSQPFVATFSSSQALALFMPFLRR